MWNLFIRRYKRGKKNNLEKNVKTLEDLTNNLLESINKIKNIFEKLNEKKDELKLQFKMNLLN